ncbi:MAG TPA: carboxypeptidase-like regulatory domain-containing protein, partial [Candidatus Limnocylindrales bacterium]|nr:carboxypeptidase-like regulatory domain-containing protein [Candidatus Limnocylindrales bacterium]
LNAGTYRVEVRGMAGGPAQNPAIRYYPINGNVSTTQTANLTVLSPMENLNVTVRSGGEPVPEANVWINSSDIKTTDAYGNYSFRVSAGTYNVTASKQPTHYDNTSTGVVTEGNTTILPIDLQIKPTGTITGVVGNV